METSFAYYLFVLAAIVVGVVVVKKKIGRASCRERV